MDIRISVLWTLALVLCALAAFNCENAEPQTPPTNNYTVTNGNVTCVVMTAGIRLTIPYVKDTKNDTVNITIPQNATYSGMCSNPDGTNQLNINFLNNWTLSFIFAHSSTVNNSYEWQLATLNYSVDTSLFPNATNLGQQVLTLTFPNGTNAAQYNGSYRCDGTRDVPLSRGVTMTMVNLSYRAFGSDDQTDISSSNVTCVVMMVGIRLTIPYVTDTKNDTVNITIPQNGTTYNGMCSNPDGTNQLNINFLNNWSLSFIFAKSSTVNNSYEWQLAILNYIVDNSRFPNATNLGQHNLTLTFPNGTNAAQFNGSYRCNGNRDNPFSMGVTMTIENLSYRAFGSDDQTDISSSNVSTCLGNHDISPETDFALALAVGIALGACIVLTVVVYVIASRARGHKNLK